MMQAGTHPGRNADLFSELSVEQFQGFGCVFGSGSDRFEGPDGALSVFGCILSGAIVTSLAPLLPLYRLCLQPSS